MSTTCNIQTNEEYVYINYYKILLEKLAFKNLLTKNGIQKNGKEYCEADSYYEYKQEKVEFYSGIIIEKLKSLTDYEIVMLMAKEDVVSYDIRRDNRFFEVIIYK